MGLEKKELCCNNNNSNDNNKDLALYGKSTKGTSAWGFFVLQEYTADIYHMQNIP